MTALLYPLVSSLSTSCSPSAALAIDHRFLHGHIISRFHGTTVFSYTGCHATCVATFHSPPTCIIYLFIWLCWASVGSMQTLSCNTRDLVPRLGMEPGLPALGAWSLSHRTTREVPSWHFKAFYYIKFSICTKVNRRDTNMIESLCCPPETIKTVLIVSMARQNKKRLIKIKVHRRV